MQFAILFSTKWQFLLTVTMFNSNNIFIFALVFCVGVIMRKTSANQLYDVPVVTSDLRHEELIHQIADSLDYLNNVMDDVFCRVQTRVSENKTRLAKITDRTRLAQAKVTHIRGRKKATQVGRAVLQNLHYKLSFHIFVKPLTAFISRRLGRSRCFLWPSILLRKRWRNIEAYSLKKLTIVK